MNLRPFFQRSAIHRHQFGYDGVYNRKHSWWLCSLHLTRSFSHWTTRFVIVCRKGKGYTAPFLPTTYVVQGKIKYEAKTSSYLKIIFNLNISRFLMISSWLGTLDTRHFSAFMIPDKASFFASVFDSFLSSSSVKPSRNFGTISYKIKIRLLHS